MTEESPPQEEDKILALQQELKEAKDKYLRTLAEMENVRKRMQKEKQETTRFAIESALCELLTPIDNFENALQFVEKMSEETRNWALGFQMILSQFKETLHNQGISPFTSKGELFDPDKHEAVETHETCEHPEGVILHEFVKGYKSGDRTIRAARVKVAKTPALNEASPIENN